MFWTEAVFGHSLSLIARPVTVNHRGLDLRANANVRRVLQDVTGRQHIVLEAGCLSLVLRISGYQVFDGPFVFSVEIDHLDGAAHTSSMLRLLGHLGSPGSAVPREFRKTGRDHWRLREALIALDADAAGASHREIAALLFGTDIARSDWGTPWLKQRVMRTIARGCAYSAGRYRELLR